MSNQVADRTSPAPADDPASVALTAAKPARRARRALGLWLAPFGIIALAGALLWYYQSLDLAHAVRQQRSALDWSSKLRPQSWSSTSRSRSGRLRWWSRSPCRSASCSPGRDCAVLRRTCVGRQHGAGAARLRAPGDLRELSRHRDAHGHRGAGVLRTATGAAQHDGRSRRGRPVADRGGARHGHDQGAGARRGSSCHWPCRWSSPGFEWRWSSTSAWPPWPSWSVEMGSGSRSLGAEAQQAPVLIVGAVPGGVAGAELRLDRRGRRAGAPRPAGSDGRDPPHRGPVAGACAPPDPAERRCVAGRVGRVRADRRPSGSPRRPCRLVALDVDLCVELGHLLVVELAEDLVGDLVVDVGVLLVDVVVAGVRDVVDDHHARVLDQVEVERLDPPVGGEHLTEVAGPFAVWV